MILQKNINDLRFSEDSKLITILILTYLYYISDNTLNLDTTYNIIFIVSLFIFKYKNVKIPDQMLKENPSFIKDLDSYMLSDINSDEFKIRNIERKNRIDILEALEKTKLNYGNISLLYLDEL
jgi:hypothetical protein